MTHFATRLDLDKKLTAFFGQGEEGKAKLVDFEDYLSDLGDRFSVDPNEKNIVAVVNVEGTIIDGESDEESAGGDTIAKLLRQAYDNEKVKAVVLRVNSPGGSAFASEIIRQETENLQKAGKPVVVSMGGWQPLVVIGFLQLLTILWQIKIRLRGQSGFLHYSQPLKIQSKKWE